jgi:uncharacterized delta-60 repeat protein
LTESGAPDPSFAGSGTKSVGGLSWLGLPAPTASGILAVGSSTDPCPHGGPYPPSVLADFNADGELNGGFSGDGLWSRPFTRISDLAAAPSGRLVLLTRTIELSHGEWIESAGSIFRLRRNGSFDRSFGHIGEARVQLPKHSAIEAITTDPQGRVLLAGTALHKVRHKGKVHTNLNFLLIRTTAAGQPDPHFGRGGRAITGFGGRSNVRATDVLIDAAGRIAVGGKFSGVSTNNAFALARYLGGG